MDLIFCSKHKSIETQRHTILGSELPKQLKKNTIDKMIFVMHITCECYGESLVCFECLFFIDLQEERQEILMRNSQLSKLASINLDNIEKQVISHIKVDISLKL